MASRFRVHPTAHPGCPQLLVDVSTIVNGDVRSGIQRVVRAMLGQLVELNIPEIIIQPVFASRNHGFCKADFLADGRLVNACRLPNELQSVAVRKGDIFLGLDLASQVMPYTEIEISGWRRQGVSINMVVYDLLPISRPEWFSSKLVCHFRRWLGVVARQADRCICISDVVAKALADQFSATHPYHSTTICTIPLGSDLAATFPSAGVPDGFLDLFNWVRRGRTILAVGTIEPRKGYGRLLDAFDQIWRSDPGSDIALLVVGRSGWKTDRLQERLRNHPEKCKRLVWLDQASDEFLSIAYLNCVGLIAASYQEGFGLPLVEALAHGTPVLARDLPIFHEVGGEVFSYFDDDSPASLAGRVTDWLCAARQPNPMEIARLPRWSDSASALAICLGLLPRR